MSEKKITITGEITHIGFRNSENWGTFTIQELPPDKADETNKTENEEQKTGSSFLDAMPEPIHSCTGIIPIISDIGDIVTITGKETVHQSYGPQIKCESIIPAPPQINSVKGILKILCRLPGIGKAKAKKFTDYCELEGLDPIETAIEKPELIGVRPELEEECVVKLTMLTKYFDHLIYLLGIGLTDNQSDKIVKEFGTDTTDVISRNPYIVIEKLPGFGFLMADKIAFKVGIKAGNPARIQACIQYCLKNNKVNGGNTYILGWELTKIVIDQLTDSCARCGASIVNLPNEDDVRQQVYILQVDEKVVIEGGKVYDRGLLEAEKEILNTVVG